MITDETLHTLKSAGFSDSFLDAFKEYDLMVVAPEHLKPIGVINDGCFEAKIDEFQFQSSMFSSNTITIKS